MQLHEIFTTVPFILRMREHGPMPPVYHMVYPWIWFVCQSVVPMGTTNWYSN